MENRREARACNEEQERYDSPDENDIFGEVLHLFVVTTSNILELRFIVKASQTTTLIILLRNSTISVPMRIFVKTAHFQDAAIQAFSRMQTCLRWVLEIEKVLILVCTLSEPLEHRNKIIIG